MKFGEHFTYEIIESAEDPGDSKIKKSGLTAEFTLNDIDRDRQLLERKKQEMEAQIRIERAKMQNINDTNPEIGEMDENTCKIIYIYQQARSLANVYEEKVAEIDEMLTEYKNEMMDIAIQTGFLTKNDAEKGTDGSGEGFEVGA